MCKYFRRSDWTTVQFSYTFPSRDQLFPHKYSKVPARLTVQFIHIPLTRPIVSYLPDWSTVQFLYTFSSRDRLLRTIITWEGCSKVRCSNVKCLQHQFIATLPNAIIEGRRGQVIYRRCRCFPLSGCGIWQIYFQ